MSARISPGPGPLRRQAPSSFLASVKAQACATLSSGPAAGSNPQRPTPGFGGMTTLIAWRNLVHDRVRFATTLVGIVFSVVLMAVQLGMLAGFSETTSGLITHTSADIWIAPRGTTNVDQSALLLERTYYEALRTEGVAAASRHIVRFMSWKLPQGGSQLVIVVGIDRRQAMAKPWNLVEGDVASLDLPNAVIVDRLYAHKLGVSAIGDMVEIKGHRARVVGFTQGDRTFTQAPYVFTSYANALDYTDVEDGDASYILVKAEAPGDLGALVGRLKAAAPNVDVMTADEFAAKTQRYWIFTTGAGSALILGAALGALVGVVIVSQTLYAATIERLPEYATLSAIGAGSAYLNMIVLKQALISGGVAYAIAAVLSLAVALAARASPAAIVLTPTMLALLGLASLAMCSLSALLAIRKVMGIDPTSVFR